MQFKRHSRGFAQSVTVFVILLGWCMLSVPFFGREPITDPAIIPPPQSVLKALVLLVAQHGLGNDLTRTLGRLLAALAAAIGLGVPLGLLFGVERGVYAYFEGLIHALRSVPAAALFPLFMLIIGVGETSIVALATYNSLMVIIIHTVAGTLVANEQRLQQARSLGLGQWAIAREVLFWEALPHVMSGIRVASGYTLALIIAVEMFIGNSPEGLGRKIFDYQAAYRIPEVYATITLTGMVGIGMNFALTLVERRLLRWVPNSRMEA